MLEVRSLTKYFGGLKALDHLEFGVEQGEIVGMIGLNGAGKTTSFNIIAGVHSPSDGNVKFKGKEIVGLSPHEICALGIARTFQIARPFGGLSVVENVMVGAFNRMRSSSEAGREAERILEMVGLEERKDAPGEELTVPERKRLELARALATRPELILLDEVMAGLNPRELTEAMGLLKRVHESGITLLVVEHVLQAVMHLCERVIVIHHGRKIAEGAPSEIARDEAVIEAYLGEEYFIV